MKRENLYTKFEIIRVVLFFVSLACCTTLFAQPFDGPKYANHWVNPSQEYVRLGVQKTGLQRVAISKLPQSFSSNKTGYLHLYHRGKEVSIISVSSEEVVFYGEVNDGSSDSLLYRPMNSRINPYTSFYSDEGAYFLTINSTPNQLVPVIQSPLSGTPLSYHFQTDAKIFPDSYSQSISGINAPLLQSYFQNGASWTGLGYVGDTTAVHSFQLKNFVATAGIQPSLELLLHGKNNYAQNIRLSIGKTLGQVRQESTLSFSGLVGYKTKFSLKNEDYSATGDGVFTLKSTIVTSDSYTTGRYSIAYYKVVYPQRFDMTGNNNYTFLLPVDNNELSRLRIEGATEKTRLFDVTIPDSPQEIKTQWVGGRLEAMVRREGNKMLPIYATNQMEEISLVTSAPMKQIDPDDYNYLIITNTDLYAAAEEYAAYRKSTQGGGYKTLVLDVKDIYNQFNYGEASPVAIRRYLDYMLSSESHDKYLFLIGRSITRQERVEKNLPGQVPAIGYPGSDYLLVEGLGGNSKDVPSMPFGRISVRTSEQVKDYLQKVITYEQGENSGLWKKNVVHLSGGKSASELNQLKNALVTLSPLAETNYFGAKVAQIAKKTTEPVETVDISSQINDGVGMVTYFGHGSQTVTDLDMGYISAPERGFSDSEKFSFMYFNGCGVGNIFATQTYFTLAEDWLLTPRKGAIAVMANTYFSYYSPTYNYLHGLYKGIFEDESLAGATIGQIVVEASKRVTQNRPNTYDITNLHQSILLGDPAVRVMRLAKPDFAFQEKNSIFLSSSSSGQKIGDSDSVKVGIVVLNNGTYNKGQSIDLLVESYYDNSDTEISQIKIPSLAYRDTIFVSVGVKSGLSGIRAVLDVNNMIEELDEENNEKILSVNWDSAKNQIIYWGDEVVDILPPRLRVLFDNRQIRNGEIISATPSISIALEDDNLVTKDSTLVDVLIKPCADGSCNFGRVSYSGNSIKLSSQSGKSIELLYEPMLLSAGDYELFVNARDMSGNVVVQPFRIVFSVSDQPTPFMVINSPNPASSYVKFETSSYVSKIVRSIKYQVYNSIGIMVDDQQVKDVRQGVNEWYWQPKNIQSGFYFYRVTLVNEDGGEEISDGKIILVR